MKKFLLSIIMIVALMPLTVKAEEILVGEAKDAKNLAPFVTSYPHSWCEMIYQANEIGQACDIDSIAFNTAGGPQLTVDEIKIYLAETTKTDFSDASEWTAEDELTLVYSGTNIVLGDDEWETFKLDTVFAYGGEKNLAVVVSKTATVWNLTNGQLTYSCYIDSTSVMFRASETDTSFAQYPTVEGMAIWYNKPVMKLFEAEEIVTPTLVPPTNLNATVEQDIQGYNYKYRITMGWDAVAGVDGYNVYVNTPTHTDYLLGHTNGLYYIVGTNSETKIEFYIKSILDGEESEASEKYTVIVEDDAVEEMTASFNIYPNPVENTLFLATELNVEEVAIYDIYGRQAKSTVYSLQSTDIVNTVDVADLNSGVYFVSIKTDKGNIVRRFIKD